MKVSSDCIVVARRAAQPGSHPMFPITSVTLVISHLHQLLLRRNNEVCNSGNRDIFLNSGKSGEEPLSPLCHPLGNFSQIQPCSVCLLHYQASRRSQLYSANCMLIPKGPVFSYKASFPSAKDKSGYSEATVPQSPLAN